MRLPSNVEVRHPYFRKCSVESDVWTIELAGAFPENIRELKFVAATQLWEGVCEVSGNVGLVEDHNILWLVGGGPTVEDAVVEALTTFLNWVVEPEGVTASDFAVRNISQNKPNQISR